MQKEIQMQNKKAIYKEVHLVDKDMQSQILEREKQLKQGIAEMEDMTHLYARPRRKKEEEQRQNAQLKDKMENI